MLAMVEGYLVNLDDEKILDRLIEHVCPLDTSLHKSPLTLRQGNRELIGTFLIHFNQVVAFIKLGNARVHETFVEAMLSNLQLYARSMLASDNSLSYDKVR